MIQGNKSFNILSNSKLFLLSKTFSLRTPTLYRQRANSDRSYRPSSTSDRDYDKEDDAWIEDE